MESHILFGAYYYLIRYETDICIGNGLNNEHVKFKRRLLYATEIEEYILLIAIIDTDSPNGLSECVTATRHRDPYLQFIMAFGIICESVVKKTNVWLHFQFT